jgi:hypothetical protein
MWHFDGRRHKVYLTWDGLWRNYVAEGDEAREVAVVGFNIWSPDGVRLASRLRRGVLGRAKDAAAATAVAALSLFAVLLPALVWTSAFPL